MNTILMGLHFEIELLDFKRFFTFVFTNNPSAILGLLQYKNE